MHCFSLRRLLPAILLAFAVCGCGRKTLGSDLPQGDFEQARFQTPEQLVTALKAAVNADDTATLLTILGPAGRDLLFSGDPTNDRLEVQAFAQRINERADLIPQISVNTPHTSVMKLRIGQMALNAGIPLINKGQGWTLASKYFAPRSIKRRIYSNGIEVWQACKAYVDAQRQYILSDHDGDGILEYAQKIISSPGTQDGLYWPAGPGEPASPLAEFIAKATAQGYTEKSAPESNLYHGYLFKILTSQGDAARGGELDYLVNGNMTEGFALVAQPIEWGVSGIKTFTVGPYGLIYGKNLGVSTDKLVEKMTAFNPDRSWPWVQEPQYDQHEEYIESMEE